MPNVWLGTSVENQETADERIGHLIQTEAAHRFVSVEPMLEAVNLGLIGTCPKDWGKAYTPVGEHIHWVIVGGESGPRARQCELEWIYDTINECRDAKVPVFVKQLGAWAIEYFNSKFHPLDPKGGDPSEWPKRLRVREYPQ